MVSACSALSIVIQCLRLEKFFSSCPLRNDSCFIDHEHNQKGQHSALSIRRRASQKTFCKSAQSPHVGHEADFLGKISLHSTVPKITT